MRGTTPGLATPHPIAGTLPGLLGADVFVQQMCEGLDDVLAPVFAVLDSFAAYLDPRTIPEDMLAWLAGWVGIELQAGESPERCRERVVAGVDMLGRRGTVRGVVAAIESVFGVVPEIVESGGSTWSAQAGTAMPGSPGARMLVRLRVADAAEIDLARLDALVAAVKPAHVVHQIEVEGDPVPEPPPAPVARPVRPVPPARTWAPSVVFSPEGTPVVSFYIHEDDAAENGVVAVQPGEDGPWADGPPAGVAPADDLSWDEPSWDTPSWDTPSGDTRSGETPSDDAPPDGRTNGERPPD